MRARDTRFVVELRRGRAEDALTVARLFRDTVRTVNRIDYSEAQVDAWAPYQVDLEHWRAIIEGSYFMVAVSGGMLVGFANLDGDDYVHQLFVHKDLLRKRIATRLVEEIEREAKRRGAQRLWTQSSITARKFFERQGFAVTQSQRVEYNGQVFDNFAMEKRLR
ncbi:MAG TPA: GNAT family N-acetyltransferase [Candidatus Cybelea sp.]|nr:GNAT family N-acetyltransferase [Candidatus Cybelea sp.]